jgi:hypothetical protein
MNRLVIRGVFSTVLLLALLSLPSIASADSILWTLTGVTFAGGGTASGSFMFDGTTFSDISITTPLNPTGYTGVWSAAGPTATGVAFGSTNPSDFSGPVLALMFSGLGLGTTPGTVSLVPGVFDIPSATLTGSGEFSCTDAACDTFTTPVTITGGEVVGTAVVVTPEPSALSLLGIGLLALLAGASRRKASHA